MADTDLIDEKCNNTYTKNNHCQVNINKKRNYRSNIYISMLLPLIYHASKICTHKIPLHTIKRTQSHTLLFNTKKFHRIIQSTRMPKKQIFRWKNNGHVGKVKTKQILGNGTDINTYLVGIQHTNVSNVVL